MRINPLRIYQRINRAAMADIHKSVQDYYGKELTTSAGKSSNNFFLIIL